MSEPDDQMRVAVMTLVENLTPYYEAAEGQKAELMRRGWSPSAAESISSEIAVGFIRSLFATIGRAS